MVNNNYFFQSPIQSHNHKKMQNKKGKKMAIFTSIGKADNKTIL